MALCIGAVIALGVVRARRGRAAVALDANRLTALAHAGRLASGQAITLVDGDGAHARILRVPGRAVRRGTNMVRGAEVVRAPGVVALMPGGGWAVDAAGTAVEVVGGRIIAPPAQRVAGHGRVLQVTPRGRARMQDGTEAELSGEAGAPRAWRAVEGARGVVDVADFDTGRCELLADGDVSCAFQPTNGAAGDEPSTLRTSGLRVATPTELTTDPFAGGMICVRGATGDLACGVRESGYRRVDLGPLPRASRVALSSQDFCVVGVDHSLWCVGGPDRPRPLNQYRDRSTLHRALDGVTEVALGDEIGCYRRTSGEVRCWGNALRDFGIVERRAPVPIALRGRAERIVMPLGFACALVGGQIWCWGLRYVPERPAAARFVLWRRPKRDPLAALWRDPPLVAWSGARPVAAAGS